MGEGRREEVKTWCHVADGDEVDLGDLPFLLFELKLTVRRRVGWVLVVSLGVIGKLSHPKPHAWFLEPVDDATYSSLVERSVVGRVDA